MNNDRTLEKMFDTKSDGVRRVGSAKLRWEDGVDQDMRTLEVKNWKKIPRQRRMGKASTEGEGPPRAVGPMMMMMMMMMMICAGSGFGLVADLASEIQMIRLFHYRGGGLSLPCKRHFIAKVICTINTVTRHHSCWINTAGITLLYL